MKFIQKFNVTVTICFYLFHSIISDLALENATNPLNRVRHLGADEKFIVEVNQGKLRGQKFESVLTNEPYYGFLGIPYAKPPLGELRFQPAQAPDPWEGVYDATHERKWCMQIDPFLKKFDVGSEDCLHLNVFTPEIPNEINASKPVMVFIHGGGFRRAAGTKGIFSPGHIMKRNVIIVMMNYRLLAFGFFNLGLPECPGNAGLKDQLMALKWVKQNIAKFGGDPEQITIFGESAGSTSVYYHLISPLSKGLFTKAIMQSGTALNPWAVTFDPFQQAFEIGKRCGFRGNDTKELLSYMKRLPADDIVSASIKYIDDFKEIYPARYIAISPSIEKTSTEAFLPDWPSNLAKIATPIPTIFGVNNKEGMLLFTVASGNALQKIREDISIILKDNFKIPKDALKELSSKVQKLYFCDKKVGKHTLDEIVDLYSDVIFYHTYESLKFLINSTTPPYIYEFAYDGQMNLYKKQIELSHLTKLKGASHADDLFYLFYPEKIPMLLKLDQETINVINNMTLMWTNFAKTGNPTGDVEWKASTINEPQYLNITETLKMVQGTFYGNRLHTLRNTVDPLIEPGSQPYEIF